MRGWCVNHQSAPGGLDVFDLNHEMKPIRRLQQAQRLPLSCVVKNLQAKAAQVEPPAAPAGAVPSLDGRQAKAFAVKPHHVVKPVSCQRDEAHARPPTLTSDDLAAPLPYTKSESAKV